jgi:hypothetical protein
VTPFVSRHASLHPFGVGTKPTPASLGSVTIAIERRPHAIDFQFQVDAALVTNLLFRSTKSVNSPASAGPAFLAGSPGERKHDLWRTTCFELFFGDPNHESYFEFHLAASGDWNLYYFSNYRTGMTEASGELVEFYFDRGFNSRGMVLRGRLQLEDLSSISKLALSATAVLELLSGDRQYWAIRHSGSKPDFHLRSSFLLDLTLEK